MSDNQPDEEPIPEECWECGEPADHSCADCGAALCDFHAEEGAGYCSVCRPLPAPEGPEQ